MKCLVLSFFTIYRLILLLAFPAVDQIYGDNLIVELPRLSDSIQRSLKPCYGDPSPKSSNQNPQPVINSFEVPLTEKSCGSPCSVLTRCGECYLRWSRYRCVPEKFSFEGTDLPKQGPIKWHIFWKISPKWFWHLQPTEKHSSEV